MKLILRALMACSSLLAMTSYAQADPIIFPIAVSLFSGPLGAVLSINAIYTGLQIAAYVAVAGAQAALAARNRQKIDPGQIKNTFQEAETSEYNAIGRVRIGGLKAFGNTKASIISRLVWHSRGEMIGIENYYLGGREVTVDDDGAVSSPPWSKPGGSWAYVYSKSGTGAETSWPQLMADYPTLWTAAHRARGIFQSLLRFEVPNLSDEQGNKKFQKLYQGGAPDLEVVARVSRVYDPRDPAQNVDNQNTWTWSDNGILCAVQIMRRYPDLTSADFDWSFIASEADRADALVNSKTGMQPRARCWGIWPSENPRGDTMQQVLDSIGAEIVMSDAGLIRIRFIDDEPVSEIEFGTDHIVEYEWKSGPDAVERPNLCRIKYYSPERGYDMAEIDMTGIAWSRVDNEIARYGEKIFDVELPFCPSAAQAQRIARRMFLSARADAGQMRTNMVGLAAWGVTYATIDNGDESELCRISPPRIDDENGQVDIPFVVWPDLPAWNVATMEADPPIEAPEIQYESELPKPGNISGAVQVIYPGGGREIRISFPNVVGGVVAEANRRNYVGTIPQLWSGMTEYQFGASWYGWATADWEGMDADFRVRFFDNEDNGSPWSDTLERRPLVVDNSSPAAPGLERETIPIGVSYRFRYTSSASINAAQTKLQYADSLAGPWTDVDATNTRPGYQSDWLTPPLPSGDGWTRYVRSIAITSNPAIFTPSPVSTIVAPTGP